MNGARSTFMRKGYLLTALAAAVLLAASPGTASAQSVGFVGESGTLMEAATTAPNTPAPLQVRVRATGLPTGAMRTADSVEAAIGTISVNVPGGLTATISDGTATDLNFDEEDEVTITLVPTTADTNWLDEKIVLKLTSDADDIAPTPGTFTVTVDDDDVAPVAKFTHVNAPNVSLQEASTTTIMVGIEPGTMTATMQGVMSADPTLSVMVNPANAMIGDCTNATGAATGNFLDIESPVGTNITIANGAFAPAGVARTGTPNGVSATYTDLTVTACTDMANFRDMYVELSFAAMSLASGADGVDGTITDGGAIMITVDSNEVTPTVSFATSSIDIEEGGTNTVAILADGATGPEVGSVMVSMSGDAMLSLWQGDDMLEAGMDGNYEVDLMGSANTILTISADSDRALEDGMTSTGTITIESASGANIGERDSLMVTVNGSTAVPALPLVGQLLLALFLMAGGARLYRRRQG